MGYLCTSWGACLNGSVSTHGGEYFFSSNVICCGDGVVTGLYLRIVWVLMSFGMLNN